MIVFDFDGVLFDSFNESFTSAVNTYMAYQTNHSLPFVDPLTIETIDLLKHGDPEFLKEFSRLMPMGNFAEDYYVILRLLEAKASHSVNDQNDFNRFKTSLPEKDRLTYQACFFTHRREKQVSDPDAWSDLLSPFPGIPDTINTLSRRSKLAIATSKDRASVMLLLDKYNLITFFKDEAILDKDFGPSKAHHLRHLHRSFSVPFEQMHFIDDKVQHLLSVRELDLNLYLALWGYNTPRQHDVAQREGFLLLRLENLIGLGNRSNTR